MPERQATPASEKPAAARASSVPPGRRAERARVARTAEQAAALGHRAGEEWGRRRPVPPGVPVGPAVRARRRRRRSTSAVERRAQPRQAAGRHVVDVGDHAAGPHHAVRGHGRGAAARLGQPVQGGGGDDGVDPALGPSTGRPAGVGPGRPARA